MAECRLCGREMTDATGCLPRRLVLRDGTVMNAPRHGPGGSLNAGADRCPDCGAERGGVHHPRCDQARGPDGRQLLGRVEAVRRDE